MFSAICILGGVFCRRVAKAHGRDTMTQGVCLPSQTFLPDKKDNTLAARACDSR